MPDVNCTVNNCKFWTSDNLCTAQNIVVQNDQGGGFSPDSQLNELAGTPANSKDTTCCQTFQQS